MKKIVNIIPVLAFALLGVSAKAQVLFKMSYDSATERYTVSVVPQATYVHPQNITGTGQVTIKVPSNQFDPVDIHNHLEGMFWEANSRNNSPDEAPDQDYISFGLIIGGIAFPTYEQGVELPLFSFQNAYGCTGKVSLVDNFSDPFMPPNSENANIGNTLTILGAGGDAYAGIVGNGECDCGEAPLASPEQASLEGFKVFPNPAAHFLNVEIGWQGAPVDAMLQVADAAGRIVLSEPVSLSEGVSTKKVSVSNLATGSYQVCLTSKEWKLTLDNFSKQ